MKSSASLAGVLVVLAALGATARGDTAAGDTARACEPTLTVELRTTSQTKALERGRLRVRIRSCLGPAATTVKARSKIGVAAASIAKPADVVAGRQARGISLRLTSRGERRLERCADQTIVVRASGIFEGDIILSGEDRAPLRTDAPECD